MRSPSERTTSNHTKPESVSSKQHEPRLASFGLEIAHLSQHRLPQPAQA
jgi:hypothetical protein